MGGVSPGLVALGAIGKPVSWHTSTASASAPAHIPALFELLPWLPGNGVKPESCKNKPQCLITALESLGRLPSAAFSFQPLPCAAAWLEVLPSQKFMLT